MGTIISNMARNWAVIAAVPAVISLVVSFARDLGWPTAVVSSALAAMASIATVVLIKRYEARLTEREKGRAPFAWNVWMNGVKIGLLTDAQYAAFQRQAFGDLRLIGAQLFNLCSVAANVAGKLFVGVPLGVFWLLVMTWVAAPESISGLVDTFRASDAATTAASLDHMFRVVGIVAVYAVMLMSVFGYRFGFRNHYGEAVSRMIRQHCSTPAEGRIHLSKVAMANAALAGT